MLMIVADNCLPECELELTMIEDLQLLVEETMFKRNKWYCSNIVKQISNSLIRSLLFDLFGRDNANKLSWQEGLGISAIDNGLNSNCSNFYPLLQSNTVRL